MARARITRDPSDARYPWAYNVDTAAGEPIDYGTVETWREAVECVVYVLTHRSQFDNALEV